MSPSREPSPASPHKGRRAVFFLVIVALAMSIVYPLRQYHASKEHLAALVRQERDIDRQTAELERAKTRLSSDAEVERLARDHLHMVRPGEFAFAITGAVPKPPVASPQRAPAKHGRPWYKAFWHWLAG